MKKILAITSLFAALAVLMAVPSFAFENVTPTEAYELATMYPDVYILDVRTAEEWKWVGHPGANKLGEGSELSGKVVNIPYMIEKKGAFVVNSSFISDVMEAFTNNPGVVLITMCRSGKRSLAAAAALEEAGIASMNMLTGFEGGKDARGYRTVNGWANDGLPYNYGAGAYPD